MRAQHEGPGPVVRGLRFVGLIAGYARSAHLLDRLKKVSKLAQSGQERDQDEAAYRPWKLEQRLDSVTIAQLVDDYEHGIHTTELTARYKLSKAGVLRLLQDAGVDMRRQGLSPEQTVEAIRLYESGLSLVRVGDRLGFGPTSIANALRAADVNLRGRHDWR